MRTSYFANRLWPPLEAAAVSASATSSEIMQKSTSSSSSSALSSSSHGLREARAAAPISEDPLKGFKNTGMMKRGLLPLTYRNNDTSLRRLQEQYDKLVEKQRASANGQSLSKKQLKQQRLLKQLLDKWQHEPKQQNLFGNVYKRMSRSKESGTRPVIEPISYSNHMIARRNWELRPGWCSICQEPLSEANFMLHFSRKDHCLLDQHFEQIVEYQRAWSADDLLFSGRIELMFGISTQALLKRAQTLLAEQERLRRVEMNGLLDFLIERELIDAKSSGNIGAATKGSIFGFFLNAHMLIHLIVPSAVLRLEPRWNIESCSSVEDFVSATYNMETLYDMCSWNTLLGSKLPNGPASTILQKSTVVRNVLSQLKAAVMENEEVEFASLRFVLQDFLDEGVDENSSSSSSSSTAGAKQPSSEHDVVGKSENEDSIENDLKHLSEFARQTIADSLKLADREGKAQAKRGVNSSELPASFVDYQRQQMHQQQLRRMRLQRINSPNFQNESGGNSSSSNNIQEISVSDFTHPASFYAQQQQHINNKKDSDDSSSSTSSAFVLPHPIRASAAETLMAIAGRAVVADLIHCRISEYMVRAEPAWVRLAQMEQTVPRQEGPFSLSDRMLPRVSMSARPEMETRPWLPASD